jgi:pteridine reductase
LSNPRALVTGGGIRVGRAIALALADAGFDLVLHYRTSVAPAREVAALIEARGRQAHLIQADLATVQGCEAVVEAAGRVDVLVNSAALYEAVPFAELTPQAWDRMQAVNCRAPALLTRGLLPGLRASSLHGGGVVINIGDIGGDRPAPGFAHYSVSKAGILMLTRALAVELAPRVRVNSVSPGTVLAPEDLSEQTLERIRHTIPAGRFGSAEDIARAVVFLTTDAPYITGQDLPVCGGRSVAGPMLVG